MIWGYSGMVLLLGALCLEKKDNLYWGLNFIGSFIMLNYALDIKAWPFFVINLAWALISFGQWIAKNGKW